MCGITVLACRIIHKIWRCFPTDWDRHAVKWSVWLAWSNNQLSLAHWVPGVTWTAQPWARQRLLSDHNMIWYRQPLPWLISVKSCYNSSIWACDATLINQKPSYLIYYLHPILLPSPLLWDVTLFYISFWTNHSNKSAVKLISGLRALSVFHFPKD